jgi:MFS family permease
MRNNDSHRRVTFREVLAIREFRALYLAQTLSVIGDQLARIAVGVMVFDRTGSSALTGLSYAVSYLPWLLGGPTLSVLADRYPRRTIMIVCDTLRALLVAVAALDVIPTPTLLGIVCAIALAEPPFASARAALIPDVVVGAEEFVAASTLGNTTSQLAVVIGFSAGGALTAGLGIGLTLWLDAVTFVVSAIVSTTAVVSRPAPLQSRQSWRRDLRDGASIVFGDLHLRWLVTASWLVVGAVIATEAVAVPYANQRGRGALTAGLMTAALPAGITVGALVVGRALDSNRAEKLLPGLALLAPLLLALTAFDPSPVVVGIIWFISGAMSSMTVIANRIFVATVRPEVRGRAFGLAAAGISTAQGIGTLVVGLLAQQVGPSLAVAAVALTDFVGLVVVTVRWHSSRMVRPTHPTHTARRRRRTPCA